MFSLSLNAYLYKSLLPLVLAALLCPPVDTRPDLEKAFSEKARLSTQKIKPGLLKGLVTDANGAKLKGKEIKIYDRSGNLLGSTVSEEYGTYAIGGIPEGEFLLQVDGEPVAKLLATPNAMVSTFMVVLPERKSPALPLKWILIGLGGAAVAIGVPIIVHNTDDSHGHESVSP